MSKMLSRISGKAAARGALVLTACGVCCAPLVIPPLIAAIAASGVGLALAGQIGLSIVALGAIGSYLFLRRRRAASRRAGSCGCSPVSVYADADAGLKAPREQKG